MGFLILLLSLSFFIFNCPFIRWRNKVFAKRQKLFASALKALAGYRLFKTITNSASVLKICFKE